MYTHQHMHKRSVMAAMERVVVMMTHEQKQAIAKRVAAR